MQTHTKSENEVLNEAMPYILKWKHASHFYHSLLQDVIWHHWA